MYSIEFNPAKWTLSHFSPTRIKEYWKEKAKESELFQSFASEVRKSTKGNLYHLEVDPNKWSDEDFSCKNITGFWAEKLGNTPFSPIVIPAGKFLAKAFEPKSLSIDKLSKKDAAYVQFAYKVTENARKGLPINEDYKVLLHDKKEKETSGFEVFVQRSAKNKRTIISYKDTDDLNDLKSDYQLAKGEKPEQLDSAMKVYRGVLEKYPNDDIIITGFSLGGSLTEIVCSSPEAQNHGKTRGFSFNGYGADCNLSNCGKGYKDLNNVICISASSDIAIGNGAHHVGKDYVATTSFEFIQSHGFIKLEENIHSLKTDKPLLGKLLNSKGKSKKIFNKAHKSSEKTGLFARTKQFVQKITCSVKDFWNENYA